MRGFARRSVSGVRFRSKLLLISFGIAGLLFLIFGHVSLTSIHSMDGEFWDYVWRSSSLTCVLSLAFPRWILALTVPTGKCNTVAISASLNP